MKFNFFSTEAMTTMTAQQLKFLFAVLSIFLTETVKSVESRKEELERWQQCDVFLAPSGWQNGGFGVFAARSFEKDEIVELAPLYLPFDLDSPVVKNSVLRDYIYGYLRVDPDGSSNKRTQELGAVVTGNTMFLNHHPTEPNLAFGNFGLEPPEGNTQGAQSVGLVATRDILPGEELFSKYGSDESGEQWFRDRDLPLMEVPKEGLRMDEADLSATSQHFCSKLYAGIGIPTWRDRVAPSQSAGGTPFSVNPDRLAPFDAGFHDAVAKVNVAYGDILETVPALVIAKETVDGTALAPLVFSWEDLHPAQQSLLEQFRMTGDLVMQHQGADNDWRREDQWQGFDQVTIFAASGHMASLRRVGGHNPNCRLDILSSGMEDGNAGIVLQLVATESVLAGEVLKLDLPPTSASEEEMAMLKAELVRTGQPLSADIRTQQDSATGGSNVDGTSNEL